MSNPTRSHLSRFYPLILLLLVTVLTAGCSAPAPVSISKTPAVPGQTATQAAVEATPIQVEPSAEPARVVLVTPQGSSQSLIDSLTAALKDLAGKDGLQVETLKEAAPGDVGSSTKVVVLAAQPSNLDQLLGASAQTQFVLISAADVPQKAANLSVILIRRDQEAFLAGYLAELVTSDWRAAGLLPSDSALGESLTTAFLNGGHYYCGRCVPLNPPVALFPLTAALPAGSDANAWNAAVGEIQKKVLDVVYVSPEASSPELLSSLASQNFRIVGSQPPPADAAGQWVATLRIDPVETLRVLWPDLIAGKGGQQMAARIAVTDIRPDWLSAGRQRLVSEMRDKLEKGEIGTLVAP